MKLKESFIKKYRFRKKLWPFKVWSHVTDRTYIPTKDANGSKTKTNTETDMIF